MWREHWSYMDIQGEAALVQRLWEKDPGWAAAFVDVAAGISLGQNSRRYNHALSRVVRAVVLHHDLPCPTGETFLKAWSAGSGQHESPLDWLASDPLMPDLLWNYLAVGLAGDSGWLADVVPELVKQGKLARAEVVERVLTLLTTVRAAKSQMVLAGVLAGLELRTPEVPGGFAYLVGAISASHGTVGKILLPMAVETVPDAAGLAELTTVVAGQPEKGQRSVLLKALTGRELRAEVGDGGVVAALDLLVTGQDAAFDERVRRARARIAPAEPAPPSDGAPTAIGLWDRRPTAPDIGERRGRFITVGFEPYDDLFSTRRERYDFVQPLVVEDLLVMLADGQLDTGRLQAGCAHLASSGMLSMSRFTGSLEDLFLAGAMKEMWPLGLAVADRAAQAPRRPPGLADLLRLLATYAVEVPRPVEVPPAIDALARGTGETKAQMEARRLGAALVDVDIASYVAASQESSSDVVHAARGLWGDRRSTAPTAAQVRIEDHLPDDLPALREVLSRKWVDRTGWRADLSTGIDGITYLERLLAGVVRAVQREGVTPVQDTLSGIERRYETYPLVRAIDLWASARLDRAMFWRLAGGDPLEDIAEARLWRELERPLARLTFLRACETLIGAATSPVLCTPTWADGTLDVDDLLDRWTDSGDAPIGPFDLVQALHRLRPADPSAADLVPLPRRLMSTATLDPQSDHPWDAADLLRTWLRAGGLPPLDPYVADGHWATRTQAPVSWSGLAAVPSEIRADPWHQIWPFDRAVVTPTWMDRTVDGAFAPCDFYQGEPLPERGTPLGLPLHDAFLGWLSAGTGHSRTYAEETAVGAFTDERIRPDLAAKAAVGRHRAGSLGLARVTRVFGAVAERGGLRGVWAPALAIADALSAEAARPAALAQLLRFLTTYVVEVPDPVVPDDIRRLALERGGSRTHIEARAYVDLVDRLAVRTGPGG